MIDARRTGLLPTKPHTAHRRPDGSLYFEHCFTRDGFDGPYSILYHERPPQTHRGAAEVAPLWAPRIAVEDGALRRRLLQTGQAPAGGSPATGRVPLLFNADLTVGSLRPTEPDGEYLANGDGDDLFYVQAGGGELLSWFGRLRFGQGDYVCVPRGVAHRFVLDPGEQHWLWVECRSGLRVLSQYRNPVGQLRMDAPYTHRDFRAPALDGATDPGGPRTVVTKRADRFTRHTWDGDVLDVVGWDGVVWPFAFHILRFSPKTGQVHLPPTVHGTFATGGSLVCSFVPRVVDYGEGAIPCPYPHSNVAVDEVIFYCDGDFTSRRGVGGGSVSLHPAGVPHGPHPGAYERSIGTTRTRELAVMIDTFEPLRLTAAAAGLESAAYDDTFGGHA